MAGIVDDLNSIKTLQNGVKNNKVTRFAYTQTAYNNNDVNGHTDYVASRDNNIPTDSISVMKVNQTVVDKGFRARASSLARMLLNHVFGRVSYNLNKLNDFFYSTLDYIISAIGQANGLVPLDSTGRIAPQYLPVDAIEYKGTWNASTNTPHLEDGTGTKGDTYFVTVAGTQDLGSGNITFYVDDRVIYNGSVWQRFSAGDVKKVSEISPDVNGNVDLSQQTDMTKIFSSDFLKALLQPLVGRVWNHVTGATSAYSFRTVYYANNLWVAGSTSHGLWTSADGMYWTPGSGGTSYIFNTVYYANNFWVAGSTSHGLWYSADGMNWTQGNGGTSYTFSSIYYANNLWVAGSESHGLWYSTDGMNWTQVTGDTSTYSFNTVYYANGIWVAGSESHGIWYSADGMNWTQATGNAANFLIFSFYTIYYANGIWVAGSGSHDIWHSVDGMYWIYTSSMNNVIFRTVYYANGIWVAGSSKGLWYSTDGMNWTQVTGDISTYDLGTIYYANNLWVAGSTAIDSQRHGLWYSADGMNWTQITGVTSTYNFSDVYYANGIWVAGSVGLGLWYSNWKALSDFFAQGGTL